MAQAVSLKVGQTSLDTAMESWISEYAFVFSSVIAGLLASLACGLGVFPLMIRGLDVVRHIGKGYSFAGGLMFAASVYNLLLPAFTRGGDAVVELSAILWVLLGMGFGCTMMWLVERYLATDQLTSGWSSSLGGRVGTMVFIAMAFHSIPEGVAVGVGYAGQEYFEGIRGMGVAVAIGIHNIPEGLAVALPMRAAGASFKKCFLFAFLTSLPQPIASVPACLAVSLFRPLMLPLLGFAAGAMMYLVVVELIPEGLETTSRTAIAWSFMFGFALMTLVQVAL